MAKQTTSNSIKKAVRAKANDVVKIKYVDGAKHHKPGEEATVHREQAKKLIAKGVAEYVNEKDKQAAIKEEEK